MIYTEKSITCDIRERISRMLKESIPMTPDCLPTVILEGQWNLCFDKLTMTICYSEPVEGSIGTCPVLDTVS